MGGSRPRGHAEASDPDGRRAGAPARPGERSFADRRDAGRRLAERCSPLAPERAVVVALPRGGVRSGSRSPGACRALMSGRAQVRFPQILSLGGAIAESGATAFDVAARELRMHSRHSTPDRARARGAAAAGRALTARAALALLSATQTIVVDDGLATGLSALPRYVRCGPMTLRASWFAVPVGARESVASSPSRPTRSFAHDPAAVAGRWGWYTDFSPVSDEEVMSLLAGGGGLDTPTR